MEAGPRCKTFTEVEHQWAVFNCLFSIVPNPKTSVHCFYVFSCSDNFGLKVNRDNNDPLEHTHLNDICIEKTFIYFAVKLIWWGTDFKHFPRKPIKMSFWGCVRLQEPPTQQPLCHLNVQHSLLLQIASRQPVTWQQLNAFSHVEAVQTTWF